MYGRQVTKVFPFIDLSFIINLFYFFQIPAIKRKKEIEEENTKIIYGNHL